MQGNVSRFSDLGLGFHFMKCRKLFYIKKTKSYPFFCHKMKTGTQIKKIETRFPPEEP